MAASDSAHILDTDEHFAERQAEALRILGTQSDVLLNAVDEGVYCLDANGDTLFVNDAGARMLGFTAREMRGKPQHALIHYKYADGTDFPAEACPIYASVHDGVYQRVGADVFWMKDGSPLPVDYTSIPIKEGRRILGAVVTFRDISDQQEAAKQASRLANERAARAEVEAAKLALEASDHRLRLALDAGRMASWEWDIERERMVWSPELERMYGVPEGTFAGTMDEYRERIHPDDRDKALRLMGVAVAERHPTHHVLHRIVRPDGSIRWLDSNGRFSYADDGRPIRLTGVSTDVTELRAESAARKAADENFHFLTESLPVQVWTALPDGSLDYVTQRVAEYFGKPAERILRDGWKDVVHPDDLAAAGAAWMHSLETGKPYNIEFRLLRADGQYGWHLGRAIPQRDEHGVIVRWFGTNTDIEDQKRAAAALNEALAAAEAARTRSREDSSG
jgi:PAS domain S-box-containing protein